MKPVAAIVRSDAIAAVFDYWTAGSSVTSGMIRRMDGIEVDGVKYKAHINHVGRRFEFKSGISICSESHVNAGVQLTPFEHIIAAVETGKVTRYHEERLDLEEEARMALWESHILLHGKPYDKGLILAYYAWIRAFRKHRRIRAIARRFNNGSYTCNELFVHAGRGIDPHVPMNADVTWTPEYCFYQVTGAPSQVVFDAKGFTYAREYEKQAVYEE